MPLDDTNWSQTTEVIDETTALLIRARGFVERGWCQYELARDNAGRGVEPTSASAVSWCIYGALRAAANALVNGSHPAFLRLGSAVGHGFIVAFNDSQETVESVLAAFDRAIACEVLPRVPDRRVDR